MGIWQVHALSSILKTPIQSVYPELGNRNVRKDMHKLIKPVSGTDKEPQVFVMWTSNRDEMGTANEIRKADGTECTFKEFMKSSVDRLNIGMGKVDGANNGTKSDSKDTSSKVNGSNGGTDSDSKDVDAKVDGSNGGTDSDRTDDDPKIDGAKVGTDSESKDVKEKVNGSNGVTDSDKTDDDPKIKGGTGSDSKDADEKVDGSNGGTDSDRTGDDPKIDGAKVGTDCDSKDVDEKLDGGNGGTAGDKTDDDAKVDGSNGGTDSDKTDDDPKIDGAKEGTDSDSKDADAKVDGSNGGTESYSKDAVANDDREQHETEHVNTDLNDHEGVSMGEKHGNKISDIDTNFDTCMYEEKHVLVNFNGKAHVGIVKETNLSSVLVDCMRRNGKKDKNSFCWPIKIRDTNWYQLTDVIAIVECSDIPGQRNRYQLDEKSWQMYSSHC
ncbi:hypothetical protein MAR_004976 [Mya arenaria]|uniref:Uncharacterized protein n=1 Tax=Mya arenaria TaxID=6604 RepID=A0ABY7F1Y5_MYAAR|nr:hypothetical protein MAR_004976 [Mya arenaria]